MAKFQKLTTFLLAFVLCFSPLLASADDSTVENKIVLFDYSLPFDVWQGNGNTSVTVKCNDDNNLITEALQFKNFKCVTDAEGNEINTNHYTVENADNFARITFNEEYLIALDDGAYYYNAEFNEIAVSLKLYIVRDKSIIFDMVFSANTWNGTDWAEFKITGVPDAVDTSLLEYISCNGNKLTAEDYDISFLGNTGIITINPEYLKKLSPGTHYFDVEFLNISGILLKIEIPDFYCKGDTDGDGKITAADARLTLRASAELEALSDEAKTAADTNNDGKISSSDARQILRASAKIEMF